eukprot:Hpha_TRINITY_DN16632_c0_g1::TRINITY_DN16632_c0_g1_i6::g.180374::m.180374
MGTPHRKHTQGKRRPGGEYCALQKRESCSDPNRPGESHRESLEVRLGDVPHTLLHADDGLEDGVGQHTGVVDGLEEELGGDGGGCVEELLCLNAARREHLPAGGVEPLAEVVEEEVEVGHDDVVVTLLEVLLAQGLRVVDTVGAHRQDHALLDARHDGVLGGDVLVGGDGRHGPLELGLGLQDLAQRPAVQGTPAQDVVDHLLVALGVVGVARVTLDSVAVAARAETGDRHGVTGDHLGLEDLHATLLEDAVVHKVCHDGDRGEVEVASVVHNAVIRVSSDDTGAARAPPRDPLQGLVTNGERTLLRQVGDGHHEGLELVHHLDRLDELDRQPRRSRQAPDLALLLRILLSAHVRDAVQHIGEDLVIGEVTVVKLPHSGVEVGHAHESGVPVLGGLVQVDNIVGHLAARLARRARQ